MKSMLNNLRNIKKATSLAFSIAPYLIGLDTFFIICSGVVSVFSIKILAAFFSKAIENVKNGTFSGIVPAFVLVVLTYFCVEIIAATIDFLDFRIEKTFTNVLSEKLHDKVARFNAIKFEDTKFIEKVQMAQDGIYSLDYYFFNLIGLLLKDIPYLLFLSVYLFSLRPVLSMIPLALFVPTVFAQFLNMSERKKLNDGTVHIKRKLHHYEEILCGERYIKDTRGFGAFWHFFELHVKLFKELQLKQWKTGVRSQIFVTISRALSLIGYYAVLGLLFDSVVLGYIDVGEFAAVFSYIGRIDSALNNIVNNRFATLLSVEYNGVNRYIELLDEEEENWGSCICERITSVDLKNVSFSYPGSASKAIDNICMNIKRGDVIAIVGENGSGKTTLANLILGIYRPTAGTVQFNEFGSDKYDCQSFYKNMSAIFQNFYKYLFSLKRNITISELSIPENSTKVEKSMREAGVDYSKKRYPNGYDTILSKKFGGTDLSGGEWQRIAIARGVYRDSNIIVLDEPTAAIDPIEESRVYNNFRMICKGKITILITHRLGAVKLASKIIFMKDGKILEAGTHEDLLRRNGEYAELYRIQSQWYQ